MAPGPRDLRVELGLGVWTDVTERMLQTIPVTVTRGLPNEAGKPTPSTLSCAFHDPTADLDPGNPLGAYYGVLGRNTPLRATLGAVEDTFTRTVSNGWGSTDTGPAWTALSLGGAASDFAVASGVGTHSVDSAGEWRSTHLATELYRTVDVAVTVTVPINNVLGGALEPANIVLRGSADEFYLVRVAITTAEAVQVSIRHHIVASTETELAAPVTVTGLTHTAAQALRVRAQIEGHTIRGKVWAVSSGEPIDWQVRATDTSITTAGWIGVRSGVASGNSNTKPIVFSYDNLEVRRPRSIGEVSSFSPSWDATHRIRSVAVKSSGVLRRLGQGATPLHTAPRRFIMSTDPDAYWPMEDPVTAIYGAPAAGTTPIVQSGAANGAVFPGKQWGHGELAPWLAPVVDRTDHFNLSSGSVNTGTLIAGPVDSSGFTTQWGLDLVYAGKAGGDGASLTAFYVSMLSNTYQIALEPEELTVTVASASPGAVSVPELLDGRMHHLRLHVQQSGANINWWCYLDGVIRTSATVLATTLLPPINIGLSNFVTPYRGTIAHGHLAWWTSPPNASDAVDAAFGHPGEPAGRRIERLCAEEGIPFAAIGDLDNTTLMGPQHPGTFLQLILECATADMGALFEPAGDLGIGYRTRADLYNQPVTVTLDYSAEQVAPPLQPTDDDQNTRNDVTAKRVDGGEYRAEQTTGPMSTLSPPDGVGRYDSSVTVNANEDDQLSDLAHWLVHLGTVPQTRYPKLTVNLAATAIDAELESALLDLGVDDRVMLENLEDAFIFGTVDQIARGYTETFRDAFAHSVTINAAPMAPYLVATADGGYKADSLTATLDAGLVAGATSMAVDHGSGGAWTTSAGQMPIEVTVGGEDMVVTAIGAASGGVQTFTVTRGANGVDIDHDAGDAVRLTRRSPAAL